MPAKLQTTVYCKPLHFFCGDTIGSWTSIFCQNLRVTMKKNGFFGKFDSMHGSWKRDNSFCTYLFLVKIHVFEGSWRDTRETFSWFRIFLPISGSWPTRRHLYCLPSVSQYMSSDARHHLIIPPPPTPCFLMEIITIVNTQSDPRENFAVVNR